MKDLILKYFKDTFFQIIRNLSYNNYYNTYLTKSDNNGLYVIKIIQVSGIDLKIINNYVFQYNIIVS